MCDGRIGKFLLNVEISLSEKIYKKYITETTILTIKSLLPSEDEVATRIDYERYKKEMKLWYYYRNGDNEVLLNALEKPREDIYFQGIDDSVFIRISPIVLSNNNWNVIKEEVLKNILYTTGNIATLLEGLLLSKILYLTYNNRVNILEETKDEIINLSQTNLLESYKDSFRINIEKYLGNYHVDFEKNRIEIINVLNGIDSKHFKTLYESLKVINMNIKSEYNPFTIGLYSLKNDIDPLTKGNLSVFENFCNYIYKLNKGRIDPKLLYIDKYSLPDVFSFNVGDVFYHSLLNNCKVIKKEEGNDRLIVYVDTKSGIYKFTNQRTLM